MHMLSEKVWWTSSSHFLTSEGGVHLAIWTIRQKPPHWRSNNRATWESTEPTSFSSAKILEACAPFSAMDLAQKIGSPIGTPKISKFSAYDISSHRKASKAFFTEQFTFGSIDKETQWRTKLFIVLHYYY